MAKRSSRPAEVIDNRPRLLIFCKPLVESTEQLLDFLAEHIDQINIQFRVKIIKVSKKHQKNLALAKKLNIEKTPTCVYRYDKNGKVEEKHFVHIRNIIRFLLPRVATKDHYGFGNTSPDDLVHKFQDKVLAAGEESSEDSEELNSKNLQARMNDFQSKRTKMVGVDSKHKIKGGRPISENKVKVNKSFKNDDDFLKRMDNIQTTPVENYETDQDGDAMLEDYYNKEADAFGRKHKNGPGGRISKRG